MASWASCSRRPFSWTRHLDIDSTTLFAWTPSFSSPRTSWTTPFSPGSARKMTPARLWWFPSSITWGRTLGTSSSKPLWRAEPSSARMQILLSYLPSNTGSGFGKLCSTILSSFQIPIRQGHSQMNKSACLMFNRCRIDYKCLQEREREREHCSFCVCACACLTNGWMRSLFEENVALDTTTTRAPWRPLHLGAAASFPCPTRPCRICNARCMRGGSCSTY